MEIAQHSFMEAAEEGKTRLSFCPSFDGFWFYFICALI